LVVGIAGLLTTALPQSKPVLVYSALPMYPQKARSAHVAGKVKLWFVLNANGDVAQAGVVSGNPMPKEASVRCLQSWKFDVNSGVSTSTRYETEFDYDLGVQEKRGEPKLTVSLSDFEHVEVSSELYAESIE
jgi:TonB family protein